MAFWAATTTLESAVDFGKGLARAFAGAAIFGLPLFMTMEMWWLGFYIPAWKLGQFLVLFFPFLVLLSWHAGFETTFSWRDDVVDALVAYAVGFVASALVLWLIGVLSTEMSLRELVGKVSLQAVPASIGALLAQSQMGEQKAGRDRQGGVRRWSSEVFLMAVGALFLSFNLAPTEEMLIISLRIGPLMSALLILLSLAAMHAFVYGVEFRGGSSIPEHKPGWRIFVRFTLVGYAVCLLLSAWILWTFGRFDGLSLLAAVQLIAVLAFPAAIGAAAARLIL